MHKSGAPAAHKSGAPAAAKRARIAGAGPAASAAPACSLNEEHVSAAAVTAYAAQFRRGLPFPHLHVGRLLPPQLLARVRDELLAHDAVYLQKRNDLYDFLQMDGLATARGNATAALRDFLYSPAFRSWIERITGVATNDTVDMSAAQYVRGSHLLCHDDDLSARRVAYILYLTPEAWDAAMDGGTLDLFEADAATGMPTRVARRLSPAWNSMAFFEVSPVSFHQVAEVLADTDAKGPRLSISGWFHGAAPARRPAAPVIALPAFLRPRPKQRPAGGVMTPLVGAGASAHAAEPLSGTDDPLAYWVSALYLRAPVVAQMRAVFERDASVLLENFLRAERLAELRVALGSQRWTHCGPPLLCNYRGLDDSAAGGILPDTVARLRAFLAGNAFFEWACGLTGAALEGVAVEARCFAQGDYTLLTDPQYKAAAKKSKARSVSSTFSSLTSSSSLSSSSSSSSAADEEAEIVAGEGVATIARTVFDFTLCLVNEAGEWPEEAGGFTSYLTADDELLSVPPRRNALSVVCREPGVMRFVKFLSAHAPGPLYDVAMQFST